MRAYVAIDWAAARTLSESGEVTGPVRGCAVDPAWRDGAPEVDEEEWEYEAAELAASTLGASDAGLVLALDLPDGVTVEVDDGWFQWAGPVRRRDLAAVLDGDLAWYGVQELGGLLEAR